MLYVGLIHHPVLGRQKEIITTSVTNLDIHDIARSCRTYGVRNYFIVTPVQKQQALVQEILDHWNTDAENSYNPDRTSALSFIQLKNNLKELCVSIERECGKTPKIIVTGANFSEHNLNTDDPKIRQLISDEPVLLLFGTGWGLHSDVLDHADYHLVPIFGAAEDSYNHLSVRSAVAIYLDRIMEPKKQFS